MPRNIDKRIEKILESASIENLTIVEAIAQEYNESIKASRFSSDEIKKWTEMRDEAWNRLKKLQNFTVILFAILVYTYLDLEIKIQLLNFKIESINGVTFYVLIIFSISRIFWSYGKINYEILKTLIRNILMIKFADKEDIITEMQWMGPPDFLDRVFDPTKNANRSYRSGVEAKIFTLLLNTIHKLSAVIFVFIIIYIPIASAVKVSGDPEISTVMSVFIILLVISSIIFELMMGLIAAKYKMRFYLKEITQKFEEDKEKYGIDGAIAILEEEIDKKETTSP